MLGLSVVESLVVITNFAFWTTAIFYSYSSSYVIIHLFIVLPKFLASGTSGWVELSFSF